MWMFCVSGHIRLCYQHVWVARLATFHATLYVSVVLKTPLPTHYSVPLYCLCSTWLKYSVARSASWLQPTGPCPFICLMSSIRPCEVCVSFGPPSMSVCSCIASSFVCLQISVWAREHVGLCTCCTIPLWIDWRHDKLRRATSLIRVLLALLSPPSSSFCRSRWMASSHRRTH